MRQRYSGFWEKYKYIHDKGMHWELLKMEIRCFTILFAKGKAKEAKKRELIIKDTSNFDVASLDEEI